MDESEDQNCGKNYDGTFRRLSAAFEAMEAAGKRAQITEAVLIAGFIKTFSVQFYFRGLGLPKHFE